MKRNKTLSSCYIAFIVLALAINIAPLFFTVFRDVFGLSATKLTLLITVNFSAQIVADILSLTITKKLGLRKSAMLAHVLISAGFILFALLPYLIPGSYAGLVAAVVVYAFGVGILETTVNPICDMIPKDDKGRGLVLMHSFYCWGYIAVVLVTTLLIKLFGEDKWWILPLLWAIVPIINALRFAVVKFDESEKSESNVKISALLNQKSYLLCLIMIIFGCAAEQAMSQWASYFAQTVFNGSKVVGNLLGVCLFAAMMGLCRILYSKSKIGVKRSLQGSCIGCVVCYLVTAFSPIPILSLIACALTGFMVALMCPNITNLAVNSFGASNASFALVFLFADIGCLIGPTLTGGITDFLEKADFTVNLADRLEMTVEQLSIRGGILVSTVFPIILFLLLLLFKEKKQSR